MEDSESILHAAEDVLGLLQKHGIDAVVIGAVALAAYHYVRQTEDIDLGVNADLRGLQALAARLHPQATRWNSVNPMRRIPSGESLM